MQEHSNEHLAHTHQGADTQEHRAPAAIYTRESQLAGKEDLLFACIVIFSVACSLKGCIALAVESALFVVCAAQYPRLCRVCLRYGAAGPGVPGALQGAEISRVHLDPGAGRGCAQTQVTSTTEPQHQLRIRAANPVPGASSP